MSLMFVLFCKEKSNMYYRLHEIILMNQGLNLKYILFRTSSILFCFNNLILVNLFISLKKHFNWSLY